MRVNFTRTLLATTAILVVIGGASARDASLELVSPLAEYKLYVSENTEQLLTDVETFVAAIKAGDVEEAKALFAPTRMSYERIEPIAELFSDLDASMDARADDYELAEQDPDFTGFHRIEYGLWENGSTDGLDEFADLLLADVTELNDRIIALTFPPEVVVGGAAVLMEEVAATKISGEEDRYSHTDLWDFQANFDGARTIFDLLRPLVAEDDPDFVATVESNFTDVDNVLARYHSEDGGFVSYLELTDEDRAILSTRVNTLAEDLSELGVRLGLG